MFLANENFPRPSILFLRDKGYAVKSIQESSQGISDEEVIRNAKNEPLIILTFDRDYVELIFRYAVETPPAVIYFRYKGNDPLFVGQQLHKLLVESKIEIDNAFTVIDQNSIRQRFYPR
jgi:predicted nuclease of predicted toxin-antitoxin system